MRTEKERSFCLVLDFLLWHQGGGKRKCYRSCEKRDGEDDQFGALREQNEEARSLKNVALLNSCVL